MKYQIQYINSKLSNIQLSNILWEVSNLELNRDLTDEHIVQRFDKRPPTGHKGQIHLLSQTDPIV